MKKLLVFISLMLSFLCTEAKPLFLEKNELLDLKSRVLFDDAMPSKLLAFHYDYYGESESDVLRAAVFYYINGKFGETRSALRSKRILLAHLEKLEGEDELLLDFLRYRIALKNGENVSEEKAYLESKKVNAKLLEDDRNHIFSYNVGDGENLFEEEKQAYYDLLLTANPVLLRRATPNVYAVNFYIRSILADKNLLFTGVFAKHFAKNNIRTTSDIFKFTKDEFEALKVENSMYSNFVLMQFHLFRGEEESAEKYKKFLRERGAVEKLLYPYAIHEAKIIKISLRKLDPIECKIIE